MADEDKLPAGGSGGSSGPLVKRDLLLQACGPIAAQLKGYQLVGINFLMMLHMSQSVGEWGGFRGGRGGSGAWIWI